MKNLTTNQVILKKLKKNKQIHPEKSRNEASFPSILQSTTNCDTTTQFAISQRQQNFQPSPNHLKSTLDLFSETTPQPNQSNSSSSLNLKEKNQIVYRIGQILEIIFLFIVFMIETILVVQYKDMTQASLQSQMKEYHKAFRINDDKITILLPTEFVESAEAITSEDYSSTYIDYNGVVISNQDKTETIELNLVDKIRINDEPLDLTNSDNNNNNEFDKIIVKDSDGNIKFYVDETIVLYNDLPILIKDEFDNTRATITDVGLDLIEITISFQDSLGSEFLQISSSEFMLKNIPFSISDASENIVLRLSSSEAIFKNIPSYFEDSNGDNIISISASDGIKVIGKDIINYRGYFTAIDSTNVAQMSGLEGLRIYSGGTIKFFADYTSVLYNGIAVFIRDSTARLRAQLTDIGIQLFGVGIYMENSLGVDILQVSSTEFILKNIPIYITDVNEDTVIKLSSSEATFKNIPSYFQDSTGDNIITVSSDGGIEIIGKDVIIEDGYFTAVSSTTVAKMSGVDGFRIYESSVLLGMLSELGYLKLGTYQNAPTCPTYCPEGLVFFNEGPISKLYFWTGSTAVGLG